jgi:hypothetical protein
MKLLPYQIEHAARIEEAIRRSGVASDQSDPGMGKTAVACAVASRLGLPVVVVAPKPTLPAWRKFLAGFGVSALAVINYEALKTGKTGLGEFRGGRFNWTVPTNSLVVFDEVGRCKGRKTQNAEVLIAAKRQGLRILMLSATAASNPLEMRAFGFALGLHGLHDFWPWAIANGCRKGRFGFVYSGGVKGLERLHRTIFEVRRVGSRMRVADVPDFPQTQIEAQAIDTGHAAQIQAIYDQLAFDLARAEAIADAEEMARIAVDLKASRACHLTIHLRARQDIELLKVEAMASLARDGMEEGLSVALFVNFEETLRALSRKLETDSIISGGQDERTRQRVIEDFQANRSRVVICNIRAGGIGISLHDPQGVVPRLALISPTFSAADLRQALGRVHRLGGARSIQKILFAANTVEERACEAVAAKLARIDALNDGDLNPITQEYPHAERPRQIQPK